MAALTFTSPPDDREELARAEVYGLLAALFYSAPNAELYAQLQVAPTEAPAPGAFLESGWMNVVAASRRLTLGAVADEYAALFEGIGKPEIFLYGSYYAAGHLNEKPLVELRDALAALEHDRLGRIVVDQQHLDLAAIARVDQPRRVEDGHAAAQGQARARKHEPGVARRDRERETGADQRARTRLDHHARGGVQVESRVGGARVARQGNVRIETLDGDAHERAARGLAPVRGF